MAEIHLTKSGFWGSFLVFIGYLSVAIGFIEFFLGIPNLPSLFQKTINEVENIDDVNQCSQTCLTIITWEVSRNTFDGISNLDDFVAKNCNLKIANARLNGDEIGKTPINDIFIQEGQHTVEIIRDGCITEKFVFFAKQKERYVVKKVLFENTPQGGLFRNQYLEKKVLTEQSLGWKKILLILSTVSWAFCLFCLRRNKARHSLELRTFSNSFVVAMLIVMSLFLIFDFENRSFQSGLVPAILFSTFVSGFVSAFVGFIITLIVSESERKS